MRLAYLIGGYSSTDDIIVDKCLRYGIDTCVIYTREQAAASETLQRARSFWINIDRWHALPKTLRWIGFGWQVIATLRRIRPDVVLSQGIQIQGLLSVLSGIRPWVLMPWGSDWALVPQRSRWLARLSSFVTNHADLIQIDCETGKNVLLGLPGAKLQPENIRVFPQGIELDVFKVKPAARESVREKLGWTGCKVLIVTRQLKPVYGVDIFLRAFRIAHEQDSTARALIIGEGPLKTQLENLAATLGLSSVVLFVGRVDRAELSSYLNAADIYVSTSYSDGTSLSLLEGMATGLPAVVTDVPANLEWICDGYNGYVAARGDPETIAAAMVKLLVNAGQRELFGGRSLEIAAARADWDANFEKFLRMFEQVTREKINVQNPALSPSKVQSD